MHCIKVFNTVEPASSYGFFLVRINNCDDVWFSCFAVYIILSICMQVVILITKFGQVDITIIINMVE